MKILILLLVFTCGVLVAADEKPASPQTFTYRITGLFSPDRQDDLRGLLADQFPEVKLESIDFDHAEGRFTFDPKILFKSAKPEDVLKRFDEKLRNISNSTFGVQPVIATPASALTKVEINVGKIHCKACSLAVYESIYKIEGVAQATASMKDGLVTALIDPAKTNKQELETAIKKKGVVLVPLQ